MRRRGVGRWSVGHDPSIDPRRVLVEFRDCPSGRLAMLEAEQVARRHHACLVVALVLGRPWFVDVGCTLMRRSWSSRAPSGRPPCHSRCQRPPRRGETSAGNHRSSGDSRSGSSLRRLRGKFGEAAASAISDERITPLAAEHPPFRVMPSLSGRAKLDYLNAHTDQSANPEWRHGEILARRRSRHYFRQTS